MGFFDWFKKKKVVSDGTKCGSVAAHRWKYVGEGCQGDQYVRCVNEGCNLEGQLRIFGNDCDAYDIAGDYILYPSLNRNVHYVDGEGTCRICRLP